jgi:ComF family protein
MRQYIDPMTSPPEAARMAHAGPPASLDKRPRWPVDRLRRVLEGWRRAAGGRCVVCRGWCDTGLCACCESRFAFARERCGGCALPLANGAEDHCVRCRLDPPAWTRAVTGVDYGYPWDRLLADFKFHQRLDHVDVLARPLLAALRDVPPGLRLVAVPLSRERLRERGYNQSWELARRLARALALEARPDALFRLRDTGHQLGLTRAARTANLHGAFVVTPRHAAWVRGAAIALVDDVLTTGATARAAARTLRASGAREVQVWTVARTPEG